MAKAPREAVPLCPRCDYNQSGACTAWQDGCPLWGTCPECGLRFEWADAFNPARKPLSWLYEHKQRSSPGLIRAWRSWWWTLLPARFWRAVTPARRTSPAVWLWPVALFGSLIFAGGVARAIAGCYTRYPWYPYLMTGSFAGRPPRPDGPGFLARLWEFVWLYWVYPLWYNNYAGWPVDQYWRQLFAVWALPVATVAAGFTCVVTLLCLRSSRRVAAVKTAHIVRAALYRLTPLVFFYAAFIVAFILQDFRSGPPLGPLDKTVWGTLMAGSLVWGWLWWWNAIRQGWLMPRARLVAALIGVIDVLTSAAVFAAMSPFFLADFNA